MRTFSLLFSLIFVFAIHSQVRAKEGGNSGGGGLFIELDVLSVRKLLYDNCERFESFKNHSVDCSLFKKKIEEVGNFTQGLSLTKEALTVEGDKGEDKTVDAVNVKPAIVQLGQVSWKSAGTDVPLKAGLQAHEFLSLMGLERTGNYTISKDLVVELRTSRSFAGLAPTRPTSLDWLRSLFQGSDQTQIVIIGHHAESREKKCALFVTNKTIGDIEDYFVVVGYPNGSLEEDYIGISLYEGTAERSESTLRFGSTRPWGNDTKFNKLKIRTSVFGKLLSVTGKNDKRTIPCILDGN